MSKSAKNILEWGWGGTITKSNVTPALNPTFNFLGGHLTPIPTFNFLVPPPPRMSGEDADGNGGCIHPWEREGYIFCYK